MKQYIAQGRTDNQVTVVIPQLRTALLPPNNKTLLAPNTTHDSPNPNQKPNPQSQKPKKNYIKKK